MNDSVQGIRDRLAVVRLPAMPQILVKLLALCQTHGAGMAEMSRLIANDAGMAVKVLQAANSAVYPRGGQKIGLMQALTTLGVDLIKTLVISESVLQTFSAFPYAHHTDLRPFWKHSLTTAVIARDIARDTGYAQPEEAYLSGLLHDVGRLALLSVAPDEYGVLFYEDDNEGLCAAERRAVQVHHAEAGALVVERWRLDSFMADAVRYHHEPAVRVDNAHPLIRMVHLAHQLASHDRDIPLAQDAGERCGVSGEALLAIHQGAEEQVQKAAAFLGIDLSGLEDWAPPAAMARVSRASAVQQQLNDEVRHITLAAEVGQSFARQKDDIQLLRSVRQSAHILFDLEDTIILLMNGSGDSLIGVSMGEQRQRLAEFSVTLAAGGGIAQSAIQAQVSFLSRQSGLLNLAEEQVLRIFDVECLVSVPMVWGGRCLGVMVGAVPTWVLPDLQRRERFLLAFGAQAAQALNAADADRGEIDRRIAVLKDEFHQSTRRVLHEVNNPLAIIKNYLGVLDEKLARREPLGDALTVLNEEIDRVGSIMSEFVHGAPKTPVAKVELNRLANNVVRLFRESKFLPAGVEIVARLSPQDCEIEGAADTLKQILVNLIKNAVEAMPKGGRIDIISSGRVQHNGATYFQLSVRDNGPGIPPETRSRLFSPVQSTKAGNNRGIGLSIVHGLVGKLGGSIECISGAGGTAFELFFPVPGGQTSGVSASYRKDRV